MRRLALVAAAALVAGCGSDDEGSSAGAVLDQTAAKLGSVRSGELDLRVLATPADSSRGVGVELNGPFELAKPGRLPVTRMRYSRVVGDSRTSATVESDGTKATVTSAGRTVAVPAERLARAKGSGKAANPLKGLDVGAWIEDAQLTDGPRLDGVATDRVTGRLRTGAAIRDVLGAVRRAGARVPEAGDQLVAAVDESVRSARAEVLTGRGDRMLRRLDLRVRLRPARELKAAIPGAGEVSLSVRMDLRKPR